MKVKARECGHPAVKALKSLARRLRSAVDTSVRGDSGTVWPEIRPSMRDSTSLASDILDCARIAEELASVDGQAWLNHLGTVVSTVEYDDKCRTAVLNAREIATGNWKRG